MRRVIATLMPCQYALWLILLKLPLSQAPYGIYYKFVTYFCIHSCCLYFRSICRIDISQSSETAHRGDIYLGWGLERVLVHFRDLLNHRFGPITIPRPPWRAHMRQKLFRLLCGSADVSVWWNLIHPVALPCLWDPVGNIFTPGLSGTIKSWHHVNTARQYSLTQ